MNDFTKEELIEIAEMMRHARKQGIETTFDLSNEVEEKAWNMINKYHEIKTPTMDDYE